MCREFLFFHFFFQRFTIASIFHAHEFFMNNVDMGDVNSLWRLCLVRQEKLVEKKLNWAARDGVIDCWERKKRNFYDSRKFFVAVKKLSEQIEFESNLEVWNINLRVFFAWHKTFRCIPSCENFGHILASQIFDYS